MRSLSTAQILADLAAEWREEALCAQVGGDAWFPEHSETGADAKKVCFSCPVRLECLNYALQAPENHGVWGGKSPMQRREIRRKAGLLRPAIGRPRHDND